MGFIKKGLDNIDVKDKRVLMRVDFNVPMEGTKVTNTKRIEAAIPSIKYCLEKGCKSVVLMSHLGRPDGNWVDSMSMKPVHVEFEKLLGQKVIFLEDCQGEKVEKACANPEKGTVILLENVRFYPEEEGVRITGDKKEKADPAKVKAFREQISKYGDVFVNDAFGTAHRAHSTMTGVNLSPKVAGFLMKKELDYFAKAFDKIERPYVAIIGGAKVADKLPILKTFIDKVDDMIICGGIAYTFKSVLEGMKIGKSLFDDKSVQTVKEIAEIAKAKKVNIHLPCDFVIADKFADDANTKIVTDKEGIPDGWEGLDCGPKTRECWTGIIMKAKTIFWNGPPGVFEKAKFTEGTTAMAKAVAEATKKGAVSIVGGGDTPTALKNLKLEKAVSHISTGGGASLELIQGLPLPGVDYLDNL